ncbi:MAG: hypothetical protein IJR71_05700 [Prevotella sp.]|nr:hypothetical protein [Prevotella sp.]
MKNLTWTNPEQQKVAQVLIKKVKLKCCGIKVIVLFRCANIQKKFPQKIFFGFICPYPSFFMFSASVPEGVVGKMHYCLAFSEKITIFAPKISAYADD